jgi:hypothetical protein
MNYTYTKFGESNIAKKGNMPQSTINTYLTNYGQNVYFWTF